MNTETLSELRAKLAEIDAFIAMGWSLDDACARVDATPRSYRRWREVSQFSRAESVDVHVESIASAVPELEAEFGRLPVLAGEVLFNRGDYADCMYVIASGTIYVTEMDAMIGEGDIVGEVGIFAELRERTATAITVTDCELVRIPRDKALELTWRRPKLGLSITQVIADRLVQNLADAQATVARLHVAGIY